MRETYFITAPVTSSQIVRVLAGWSTHSVPQIPIRPVNNPSVSVEVARVKMRVSDNASPVVGPPIAHIGKLMDLQSAQINGDDIVLNWRTTAQPDQNYTVFVHGLDAQGQIVAQNDVAFGYSAVYWHVGEVFEQRIPLKDRIKVVTIKIGVYDPVTLVRLTAQSADGAALAEDSVMLAP